MLTILTRPLPSDNKQSIKMCCHHFLKFIKARPAYDGHYAVTRSLIEGLKRINGDFNYNPVSLNLLKENVVVLFGIDALRKAIELKKQGKIKKLLAGPNFMLDSKDYDEILGSGLIDCWLVPSEWVKTYYEDVYPKIYDKTYIWFVGIDENYWKPSIGNNKANNVILYVKKQPDEFINKVETLLINKGFNPKIIIYGKYNRDDYKKNLSNSRFSVFLSRSESQGIALAESWAMDVPTIVWDPEYLFYNNHKFRNPTSCPYLNEKNGIKWKELSDFERILSQIDDLIITFKPRKWLLENMTDVAIAKNLMKLVKGE